MRLLKFFGKQHQSSHLIIKLTVSVCYSLFGGRNEDMDSRQEDGGLWPPFPPISYPVPQSLDVSLLRHVNAGRP